MSERTIPVPPRRPVPARPSVFYRAADGSEAHHTDLHPVFAEARYVRQTLSNARTGGAQ